VKANLHWLTSADGPADYHDQKEIALGPLVVRRMSASVNDP
jgi:hypothetical protein